MKKYYGYCKSCYEEYETNMFVLMLLWVIRHKGAGCNVEAHDHAGVKYDRDSHMLEE